ncbi:glycoside hydrolase family 10 protein [Brachybacterium huguangmaarense]
MASHLPTLDRRDLLRLSLGGVLTGAAYSVGLTVAAPSAEAAGPGSPRQFRALWIASVVNIDFPSRTGLSASAQRREFVAWLDLARRLKLNAVISQVRPTADAFWPSPHEPWSRYLTGTQGKDPGYDPLAFQVRAAHARGLEYHAWFNPYRAGMSADPNDLVPTHPARIHPDWRFAYAGKLYYDPGVPDVRRFVQDAMMDAVTRYDIDAVHFDDYFYPYPVDGRPIPDQTTYARFGGGAEIGAWRRGNVDALIREMRDRIRAVKPWVKFGVSPFGIWRNSATDPLGSATSGTQSYDAISADTRAWVKNGWIDYICPQIYWQIKLPVADYAVLARWWEEVVRDTDVALYIGQAVYKTTSGVFTDRRELARHLEVNATLPRIAGDAYFSGIDVRADPQGAMSAVVSERYTTPAIIPTIEHMGGRAPGPATQVAARARKGGAAVGFRAPYGTAATCGIWRLDSADTTPASREDAGRLVATARVVPGKAHSVRVSGPGRGSHYAVVIYDANGRAGAPVAATVE